MTIPKFGEIHPETVAGLLLLGALYLLAVGPLRRRFGWADRVSPWRIAAFLGGLGVTLLTVQGPLHDLSERALLSVHMVQHLLLTLVIPPLLLAGVPGWLIRPVLSIPGAARLGRRLTRPALALPIYAVALTAWHVPALYEWALDNHGVHILEHVCLVAAGLLLWWPVLSPLPEWPRPSPPARLLYLFVAGIPMVPVAAFITLSDGVLYPFYGDVPWQWGLSPLEDQRLGGVIMWVGGPLAFLTAMTIVFFRWMGRGAEPAEAVSAKGGAHGAL